jgi:hypothetical protein
MSVVFEGEMNDEDQNFMSEGRRALTSRDETGESEEFKWFILHLIDVLGVSVNHRIGPHFPWMIVRH